MAKQSILFSFDSATNRFKPLALIGSQTEAYTESNPIPESVFDNFAYTANYTCYIKNGRAKGLPENEAYVTYTVNKSDATGSGSQEALVVGPDTMKTPRRFMRKSGFIDGAKKWGPWEELMTSTNIGSSSVLNRGVFVDGNVLSEPRGTMNFQASTSNLSALNLEGRGATWVHLSHFAHANNGYAFQMAAKIYNGDPTTTNDEKNWGMKLRATVPTGTSWGPWHNVVSYPEDDNTGVFGYRTVGDWNLLNSGTLMIGAGKGAGQLNGPQTGTDDNGLVLPMFYTNKKKGVQLWYATENEPMGYVRILNNSRWGSWRKIFDMDRMFFTQDGVVIKSNVITNNVQVREPSGETEPLYLNKYLNNPVAFKYNGKYITLQSLEDRFSKVLMSERVNDSNKDILNAVTNISGERIYSGDFNHHAGLPSSNRYGRIIHFGWSSGYTAQLHIGTLHHGDQVFAGTALAYIRNGKPRTTTNEWGPWHEIGAYPMIVGNNSIDEYIVRAADWNLDRIRKYFAIEHGKSNVKNSPDPSETSGAVMSIFRQINYGTQLHFSTNYNRLYLRSIHGGTWKPWVKIADGDRLNFLNNGVIIRDDLQVEKIDGYKNSAFVDLLLNTKGDKHVKFKAGDQLISLQEFYKKASGSLSATYANNPPGTGNDLNNMTIPNTFYKVDPEFLNGPRIYGTMHVQGRGVDAVHQIIYPTTGNKIFFRNYWNHANRTTANKWSEWKELDLDGIMHYGRYKRKDVTDANEARESFTQYVLRAGSNAANRPTAIFTSDNENIRLFNFGESNQYLTQIAMGTGSYRLALRFRRDDNAYGVNHANKFSQWQQILTTMTPIKGRVYIDSTNNDLPEISLAIGVKNSGLRAGSGGVLDTVINAQSVVQLSQQGMGFFGNHHKIVVNNIESRGNENLNLNANKEGGVLFRTSEGGAITLQRFHESTHLVGDISHNLSGGRDANKMYAHNGWYMLRPSSDSNGVQNGPNIWGTMHTGGYSNTAIHQIAFGITAPVISYRHYLSNESGKDVTNDESKWSDWHHLDFRKVVQEDKWSYHNVASPDEATSINKVYQLNGNGRNKPLGDDGFFRIFNIGNDKNYYGQFAMSYSRGIIVFRNRRENGGSSVDSATKFEKQWKQIVVTDTPVVGKISVDATSTSSGTPSFSLCIGDSDTGFNKADGGHAIDIYTDGVYTGKLRHGTLTMIGANSKVSAKNITGEAGNTNDHHLNLNTTNNGNVNFKTSGGQIVSLQDMYNRIGSGSGSAPSGPAELVTKDCTDLNNTRTTGFYKLATAANNQIPEGIRPGLNSGFNSPQPFLEVIAKDNLVYQKITTMNETDPSSSIYTLERFGGMSSHDGRFQWGDWTNREEVKVVEPAHMIRGYQTFDKNGMTTFSRLFARGKHSPFIMVIDNPMFFKKFAEYLRGDTNSISCIFPANVNGERLDLVNSEIRNKTATFVSQIVKATIENYRLQIDSQTRFQRMTLYFSQSSGPSDPAIDLEPIVYERYTQSLPIGTDVARFTFAWNRVSKIESTKALRFDPDSRSVILNDDQNMRVLFKNRDGSWTSLQDLFQSAADGKGLFISGLRSHFNFQNLTSSMSWSDLVGKMGEGVQAIRNSQGGGTGSSTKEAFLNRVYKLEVANRFAETSFFSGKPLELILHSGQTAAVAASDEIETVLNDYVYMYIERENKSIRITPEVFSPRSFLSTRMSGTRNDIAEITNIFDSYLYSPYGKTNTGEKSFKILEQNDTYWFTPTFYEPPRVSGDTRYSYHIPSISRLDMHRRPTPPDELSTETDPAYFIQGQFIIIMGSFSSLYIRRYQGDSDSLMSERIDKDKSSVDFDLKGFLINTKDGIMTGINNSLVYRVKNLLPYNQTLLKDVTIIYLVDYPLNKSSLLSRTASEKINIFEGKDKTDPVLTIKNLRPGHNQNRAYIASFGFRTHYSNILKVNPSSQSIMDEMQSANTLIV